ncbi:hypothetical protein JXR93_02250 [bacterium]|nr:hypothetical protein [bacterium]
MKSIFVLCSFLMFFNSLFASNKIISDEKNIVFDVDNVDDDIIRLVSKDKKVEKYLKSFKIADRISEGDSVIIKNGKVIKIKDSNNLVKINSDYLF